MVLDDAYIFFTWCIFFYMVIDDAYIILAANLVNMLFSAGEK